MKSATITCAALATVPAGVYLFDLKPDQVRRRVRFLDKVAIPGEPGKFYDLTKVAITRRPAQFKAKEEVTVSTDDLDKLAGDCWLAPNGATLAAIQYMEKQRKRDEERAAAAHADAKAQAEAKEAAAKAQVQQPDGGGQQPPADAAGKPAGKAAKG